MNSNLIASAILVVSVSGLIVINKTDNESHSFTQHINPLATNSIKASGNLNEGFLAAAYKEHEAVVAKEQADPAKKAEWAARAKEFEMPSGHCPTSAECN